MDDTRLAKTLGKMKVHWDAILEGIQSECPKHTLEWKNYGKKHGWQLKIKDGKRALLYLVPEEGSFRALMALSEPAVRALRDSDLPKKLVGEIEEAKIYPEGRPARVSVKTKKDAAVVTKLIALKLGQKDLSAS